MSYINETREEIDFTKAWWLRTLADRAKLYAWLQKLRHTEYGGFLDYNAFVERFKPEEKPTRQFQNIAADELKHSGLISDLLSINGQILLPRSDTEPSLFWGTMNEHIVDLQSAAAVNYFGEALAAFRFEVILSCDETPTDIRNLFDQILPDEQFHREALMRMAGEEMLTKLSAVYRETTQRLKKA